MKTKVLMRRDLLLACLAMLIFAPIPIGLFTAFTVDGSVPLYVGIPIISLSVLSAILFMTIPAKKIYSKIIFSNDGIEWVYRKKQVKFFAWSEITDVQMQMLKNIGNDLVVFYRGTDTVSIECGKRMYKAVTALCANKEVKTKFKALVVFQYNKHFTK